jgi:lipid-binding SYLF domain-containing protein
MAMRMMVAAALVGIVGAGCSNSAKSPEQPSTMSSAVEASLTAFQNADPSLRAGLDKAAGYAVLPDIGKGGLVVGGAYGSGEVFQNHALIGYCDLTQGTVGLQAGAQTFSELIIFHDQASLDQFKSGNFSFGANVSAVAIKPGAAASAESAKGISVFIRTTGGLMAEASVGGQKFRYRPLNGQPTSSQSSTQSYQ